jgi:hypothetical protein
MSICDWELALRTAVDAYRNRFPVVVLDEEEHLLHGAETLQAIVDLGIELQCFKVSGVNRKNFEESEWPEVLEAARRVFMKDGFPK